MQLLSYEQPLSAPCLYHGRCCSITPPGLCREDVLWIDCGSPSCTAWSARGKRLGWLDVTNIPATLWVYFLSKEGPKPDIVFGENVPGFDLEWWKSLSPANQLHHATVGPIKCGVPVTGDRVWWAGFAGEKISLSVPFPLAEDRLTECIYRSLDASPSIFVQASLQQVSAFEDYINQHGANLAPHPRGKCLMCEHYMSTAAQLRLEEHRANAVHVRMLHPLLAVQDFYFYMSQHLAFSKLPDGMLPRSATSSSIWSESQNRLLHPLEMWASQGPHVSCSLCGAVSGLGISKWGGV